MVQQIRRLIGLAVVLVMPFSFTAQYDEALPLTRVYSSSILPIAFRYPSSWLLEELDVAVILFPEASDVTILVMAAAQNQADTSPAVTVLTESVELLTSAPVNRRDIIETTVNDYPAARLDMEDEGFRTTVTAVVLSDEVVGILLVLGRVEELQPIAPTLHAILQSFSIPLPNDNSPPEDAQPLAYFYDSPDNWLTFHYAADWRLQEIDDSVELIAPNRVAISLAVQPVVADSTSSNQAFSFIKNLLSPNNARRADFYTSSIRSYEIGGRPAASVDLLDQETLVRLIAIDMSGMGMRLVGEPLVVTVTILGNLQDVRALEIPIQNLVESIRLSRSPFGDSKP
jgi:hypothetical protein